MATTSQAVKQLSDGNSVGTVMGQSTTDKIAFYGATAGLAQSTIVGSLTSISTASVSTAGIFGYTTSTQANAIAQAVIQLQRMGLIG